MNILHRQSSGRSLIMLVLVIAIVSLVGLGIVLALRLFPIDDDNKRARHVAVLRQGIDVSHFQGLIHWPKVATDNIQFAYVKATGGRAYVDPKFHINWNEIREVELQRGAYHFFYASVDAKRQAEHFSNTVKSRTDHDLAPMLDIEILDGTDPKLLVGKLLVWLNAVEKEFDKTPVIYSDISFAKNYLDDPRLSRYPFWVAEYNDKVSALPENWVKNGWTIWQHSETGEVKGIEGHVDLDLAHPAFLSRSSTLLKNIENAR